jgi:hypothetical protein
LSGQFGSGVAEGYDGVDGSLAQVALEQKGAGTMLLLNLCISVLSVVANTSTPAAEPDKSRAAVDAWYAEITKDTRPVVAPKIALVDDPAVHAAFPDDRFFTIQFPRYPLAIKPPAPLKLENLIRVHKDSSVQRIADTDALKKLVEPLFSDKAGRDQIRTALHAFLRLAEEFYQDGYYEFTITDESISAVQQNDHYIATGKATVTRGGKGTVTVTVTTGAAPKIDIGGQVRPDVRRR